MSITTCESHSFRSAHYYRLAMCSSGTSLMDQVFPPNVRYDTAQTIASARDHINIRVQNILWLWPLSNICIPSHYNMQTLMSYVHMSFCSLWQSVQCDGSASLLKEPISTLVNFLRCTCRWCSMAENAFHMVFQEIWVFSHSSPNAALAATQLLTG